MTPDYQVKGTTPGYDVHDAVDYLQSFNASWPLLKVHNSALYTGTYTHGLGYPPMFIIADATRGSVDVLFSDYGVDSSVLTRASGSGTPRYFVFRQNLTQNFKAPIYEGTTEKIATSNDYVFKLSKDGKSSDSDDMRDFALHSDTKSPMVQEVSYGTMSVGPDGWIYTVTHGLGYTPTVFVYFKPNANSLGMNPTRFVPVPPQVGASNYYYTANSTTISVTALGDVFNLAAPECSVVILKDPLIKEIVNVTYP